MLIQPFNCVFELVRVPRLPRADPPRNPKTHGSCVSVGDPAARHNHSAVADPDGHLALHPDPVNVFTRQTMPRDENTTGTYIEQRLGCLDVEVNNCHRRVTTTAFLKAAVTNVECG